MHHPTATALQRHPATASIHHPPTASIQQHHPPAASIHHPSTASIQQHHPPTALRHPPATAVIQQHHPPTASIAQHHILAGPSHSSAGLVVQSGVGSGDVDTLNCHICNQQVPKHVFQQHYAGHAKP